MMVNNVMTKQVIIKESRMHKSGYPIRAVNVSIHL